MFIDHKPTYKRYYSEIEDFSSSGIFVRAYVLRDTPSSFVMSEKKALPRLSM